MKHDSHAIFHAFQIRFGRFIQITIKRIKLNLKMLLRHKLNFHLRDQTQFAYWKSNQIDLSNSQWWKETSSSKRSGAKWSRSLWLKFYCSCLLEKYNFISSFFSFPSAVVAHDKCRLWKLHFTAAAPQDPFFASSFCKIQ